MPHFHHYIGIDYSGAETADDSCKGIRVFIAGHSSGWAIRIEQTEALNSESQSLQTLLLAVEDFRLVFA